MFLSAASQRQVSDKVERRRSPLQGTPRNSCGRRRAGRPRQSKREVASEAARFEGDQRWRLVSRLVWGTDHSDCRGGLGTANDPMHLMEDLSVELAVVDRLQQMIVFDLGGILEIGNGPGDAEDFVVGAGGESHFIDVVFHQVH